MASWICWVTWANFLLVNKSRIYHVQSVLFRFGHRSVTDFLITVTVTLRSSGQNKFAKCYRLAADCVEWRRLHKRKHLWFGQLVDMNNALDLTLEQLLGNGKFEHWICLDFLFSWFFTGVSMICSRFGRFGRALLRTNLTKKNYVKPSKSRNTISLKFAQF